MQTSRASRWESSEGLCALLLATALTACSGAPAEVPGESGSEGSSPNGLRIAEQTNKCVPRTAKAKPPFDLLGMKGEQPLRYKPIGLKPICPNGEVPLVKELFPKTPKRNPLVAAERMIGIDPELEIIDQPAVKALIPLKRLLDPQRKEPLPPDPAGGCDGVDHFGACYYYANAAFSRTADGGGMITSINKPAYSNFGGSGHTLNEIAVQGGTGNGNIVELGWNVSTDQYGDDHPHMFVFHWKDWSPTCYDGCGWQQYSSTYHPGQDLNGLVGRDVYIGYVEYAGNWWAWFDNQWLGYFPGGEWAGAYTQNSLIQWFGEVATHNGVPPTTDMGNGQFSGGAGPARMSALCDVDEAAWVCWYRDQQATSATVPGFYDMSRRSFGSVAYGGDGGA